MYFPLDELNNTLDRLSHSQFYKSRIPTSVTNKAEFSDSVPLMSRSDLVMEMKKPNYGAFGGANPVRVNLSPMGDGLIPILQTRGDINRIITAARSNLDACRVEPGDTCAVFFSYHLFVAGLFYQSQMEAHGVASIALGPGETKRAVDICISNNVNIIAGNPTFVLRLIEEGVPAPKVFFSGGEPFTTNHKLYNSISNAMPETMIVDSFSLSEFLPVGRTFPGGKGVHIFDELVYAEVIDPESLLPVNDGERGELVLTHLYKEAQPLLRYRTGDLTLKIETPSVFGRTQCLPYVVFGRTDDMIKVKGVKLYPSEIKFCLLGITELDGPYRVSVFSDNSGRERICLLLQGSGGDEVAEEVSKRFKAQTMIKADIVEIVETLESGPQCVDKR
ncbi:MAG: hypothetical protein CMM44_01505 [Rhodospirillaceae bacterium]|nr:hypothetical protein [Rhodospirillaceae bacterium]